MTLKLVGDERAINPHCGTVHSISNLTPLKNYALRPQGRDFLAKDGWWWGDLGEYEFSTR